MSSVSKQRCTTASLKVTDSASCSKNHYWPMIFMIIVAQFSNMLILPGLPHIGEYFHVSDENMRWLISVFLLGVGLGQLIFGPWSDQVGRRPILLLGMAIGCLGSLISISNLSYGVLLAGRFLTGFGISVLPVLARSSLRDLYEGRALLKVLSIISIVASFAPTIAPALGGWMVYRYGWNSIFEIISLMICSSLFLFYKNFQETRTSTKSGSFQISQALKNYLKLAKDPYFLTRFSGQTLLYLVMTINLSLAPFLLQRNLGFSAAQFGWWMTIPSLGILIGGILSTKFASHTWLKVFLLSLWAISGLLLLTLPVSAGLFLSAIFLQRITSGALMPIFTNSLLTPYKNISGTVVALSGSLQFIVSGALGGFLSRYFVLNATNLGITFLVSTALASAIFISWRFVRYSNID